jgi:glycosyltransferase involved in cell wall biosynthesis
MQPATGADPAEATKSLPRLTNDSTRRNVLFIPGWYPSAENPVAADFIRQHALAAALFDNVTVLRVTTDSAAPGGGHLSWREEQDGPIRTIRIHVPRVRGSSSLGILAGYQRLRWRGYRPDVVHAYVYHVGVPAALISKLYRVPLVFTEMWTGFPMKELSRFGVVKARIAFESAACVCPISTSLQNAIADYGIKARFKIVPCTVDTEAFRPKIAQPNGETKQLVYIAILDQPRKGLNFLLEALSALSRHRHDFHLHVVGDGPRRSEYEGMATELGVRDSVTFHGRIEREEIVQLLHRSHLFVLPSLFENFSVATAEAIATGTPVVATRCGGPEDFVTEEVGLLVPPGDVAALSEAVDWMLDHCHEFDPAALAAYARSRFSHEAVGRQLHEVYQEAVSSR